MTKLVNKNILALGLRAFIVYADPVVREVFERTRRGVGTVCEVGACGGDPFLDHLVRVVTASRAMPLCSTMNAVHWYPRTRVLPQAWLCSGPQAALVPSATAAFALASTGRYDHSLCEHCPYDHRAQRSNGGPIALSHPSTKRRRRSSVSQATQIKASSTVSWHTPSAPWGLQRSISPWSIGVERKTMYTHSSLPGSESPIHAVRRGRRWNYDIEGTT
jgi:hypothetical protein